MGTWYDNSIVIDGPIKSDDGYGHMTENQVLAFSKAGYDVICGAHWTNITNFALVNPRVQQLASRGLRHAQVGMRNSQPDSFDCIKTDFKMGFSMFEFTKLPASWLKGCNWFVHVNLVPSRWCKEIWQQGGVTKPVEVNWLGADPEVFTQIERPVRDVFTFYMSGTLSERKAPWLAWQAFQDAFPNNPNVRLIVKAAAHLPLGHIIPQDDPRITCVDAAWTKAQMAAGLHAADCFVYPTRSEGFGMSPVEAMCTGLPVICTGETACKDFMLPEHSYPLEITGWETVPSHWGDIGAFTSPSREHLAQLMKHVYEHQDEARQKGIRAAQYVRSCLTWDHHVQRMVEIIKKHL